MKIQKEKTFIPITITLENEDEVAVLHQIGNWSGKIASVIKENLDLGENKIKEILNQFYCDLEE